jgi:hypothetical protein
MPSVPLDLLPPAVRESVRKVLDKPTLATRGPAEVFRCHPGMYQWLLEHPDSAISLWRVLGARVTDIENRGNGRFGYRDENGSDVHWDTVLRLPGLRVWYAEGQIKPAFLVPRSHVEVVIVLSYRETTEEHGRTALRHQMHLLVKTDSRAVALAARLLGGSAPKLAEQYMEQLQMFYGALAWYLDQSEERAQRLFRTAGLPVPSGTLRSEAAQGVGAASPGVP